MTDIFSFWNLLEALFFCLTFLFHSKLPQTYQLKNNIQLYLTFSGGQESLQLTGVHFAGPHGAAVKVLGGLYSYRGAPSVSFTGTFAEMCTDIFHLLFCKYHEFFSPKSCVFLLWKINFFLSLFFFVCLTFILFSPQFSLDQIL